MDWIEVEKEDHQIDNCVWVECIAEIRKNETGEVREYETHEILEIGDEHPSVFNWEENNYSCDCNRHRFFKRAGNEDTPWGWDVEYTTIKSKQIWGILYLE